MSQQYLSPYINFQGRAREAMEFSHKVLGGKLDLQTVNKQGASKPAGPADRITHARSRCIHLSGRSSSNVRRRSP